MHSLRFAFYIRKFDSNFLSHRRFQMTPSWCATWIHARATYLPWYPRIKPARLALSIFRLQCFTLETMRAKWQYSGGTEVVSRAWFSESGPRMLASGIPVTPQWDCSDGAAAGSHRVPSRPFDLRGVRIRARKKDSPFSRIPILFDSVSPSRGRMRFGESVGLMVYTSWRRALVKTRKSSRGRSTLRESRRAVKEILLPVADSRLSLKSHPPQSRRSSYFPRSVAPLDGCKSAIFFQIINSTESPCTVHPVGQVHSEKF